MSYDDELADFRRVLDSVETVGYPRRDAELAELRRLVERYPDEAAQYLAETRGAT